MPRESRSYRRRSRSKSRSISRERTKRRKKSRSRSIERRRSRERSRRSRSRGRRRPSRSKSQERRKKRRSRSRERRRDKRTKSSSPDKEKSKSPNKIIHREGALHVKDEPLNKEEEQKRLEMEMQKRRERIEQWRTERKKTKELIPINIAQPTRAWTLEDEDDEDEDVQAQDADDDEVDPLDAYMISVGEEVKQEKYPQDKNDNSVNNNNCTIVTTSAPSGGKVTFITAVAKNRFEPSKKKGELMESNQDAMEYSSEEEEEGIDVTMANIDKMKKKDLVAVDHNKIYYAPFRKNFFVEVPEIAVLSQEEVDLLREELEGIKVRGKNCPRPIKQWSQCGVSKKIHLCLKKYEYEKPTPIQSQAVPVIMCGRDMIGIAKTGSGKTLAFLLPLFRHILDQPELSEEDGPIKHRSESHNSRKS